jgi:hypothetical protein
MDLRVLSKSYTWTALIVSTAGSWRSLQDHRFSAVTVRTGPDMLDEVVRCRDYKMIG